MTSLSDLCGSAAKPPRPSRQNVWDALYVFNVLAESLIEHNGRVAHLRIRRPSWRNRRDAADRNTLAVR